MIVAIEGLIWSPRCPRAEQNRPSTRQRANLKAAWLRKQPGEPCDPAAAGPRPCPRGDEPSRPASPGVPGSVPWDLAEPACPAPVETHSRLGPRRPSA